MRANIIFEAKINEAVNEWRMITGRAYIRSYDDYREIVRKLRLNFAGMPDVTKFGCVTDGDGLIIIVSGYVKNLFPEGHKNHAWAWEISKAGKRGRQMEYIVAYRFGASEKVIPYISAMKKQAEWDASNLLKQTYDSVEASGKGYLSDQPMVSFTNAGKGHEGVWRITADCWLKGELPTPFIAAADEYITYPSLREAPGRDPNCGTLESSTRRAGTPPNSSQLASYNASNRPGGRGYPIAEVSTNRDTKVLPTEVRSVASINMGPHERTQRDPSSYQDCNPGDIDAQLKANSRRARVRAILKTYDMKLEDIQNTTYLVPGFRSWRISQLTREVEEELQRTIGICVTIMQARAKFSGEAYPLGSTTKI